MYRNCPEYPDIARALRTGYPHSWDELYERHLMGHCYDELDTSEDEYDDFGLTGAEDDEEGERE